MTDSDNDSMPSGEEATPSSPPSGRRGQRQWQTRARLVAGARNVFAQVGVAEATIAQITNEADVGFGTFYLYFKTKDDALHAVLVEGFTPLNAQIDVIQRQAQQSAWEETLKDIVAAYLSFANENRDLMQIMFAEQTRFQQAEWQVFLRFAWRIVQLLRRAHASFSEEALSLDFTSAGSEASMVPYPLNLLTAMVVAILNRTAIWWLRRNPAESDEGQQSLAAVSALIAQFIIAGLASVLTTHPEATGKDQGNDETDSK